MIPAVRVSALDEYYSPVPNVEVADFSDTSSFVVAAEVRKGGGQAAGRVGLREVLRSSAWGTKAHGSGDLWQGFTVEDPQQRPVVKTILEFKAYAVSGAPREEGLGVGEFRDASGDAGMVLGRSYGNTVGIRYDPYPVVVWEPELVEELFSLWAVASRWVSHALDNEYYRGSYCFGGMRVYGQVVRELPFQEGCDEHAEAGSLELTHSPGLYVMSAWVAARVNGLGVSDPVWRPHPDNPDVVIRRHGPAGDPGPLLAGITPEELVARGIDPTLLIELGFFDAPPPPPPGAGDTTPPTTVASPTPGPNANGWNNGAVTVTLTATDETGGSGVKEIHVALSGATVGSQVVSGSSAPVRISAEGETTLAYFAVDHAGNAGTANTRTVRIDITPPVLAGLPAAGCALWPPNHRLVRVASVTASDALSGLAAGAPTVTATSNEPEIGAGDGDLAPDAVISSGVVQLRAERAGTGHGRTYTITASATDRAANLASVTTTCVVPHDLAGRTD